MSLGPTLSTFGALAGSTVTNTGATIINANVGVSPGTAITGFPPGIVIGGGAIHANTGFAATAQGELTAAYNTAAGTAFTANVSADIGGQTLPAGVYRASTSLSITGILTLNGGGNPNAQFIFQIPTTLITAGSSQVILINGAQAANVFWQVGSSATLGTTSIFAGNILALTSITLTTGASLNGRALARNGAVTFDTNTVTVTGLAPVGSADLAVTKSGPASSLAGQNVVFTVSVSNNGPTQATSVVVTDPTPAGVTFVSNSGACSTPYPCSLGTLSNGQSAVITSTYSVPANYASASLSNTAFVSSATADPTPANNTATAVTAISPTTDVSITKSGPNAVVPGQNAVYSVVVTNNGPSSAAAVSVTDPTPANLTFVSNSGGCVTAYPCSLGTLTSGQTVTITSTYSTSGAFSGSVTNTATVSTSTNDSNAANNSASKTTTVTPDADVSITKSGPNSVIPGQNVVYSVVVTNNGPNSAATVSVADPTPANLTFVSNSGGCVTAYPCSLGTLTSGQSVTITSTYSTSSAFSGSVTNTATVSSSTSDSNAANNSASKTTTLSPQSDLSIVKSGPATVSANTDVTYTITVSNAGPNTAASATVTDVLPASVVFVSATPSQGSCSGTTTVTCSLGSLANAGSATVTLVVHVNAAVPLVSSIQNTATVTSTTLDPTPGNNSSTATATLPIPTIPTLSSVGFGLLGFALAMSAAWFLRPAVSRAS